MFGYPIAKSTLKQLDPIIQRSLTLIVDTSVEFAPDGGVIAHDTYRLTVSPFSKRVRI